MTQALNRPLKRGNSNAASRLESLNKEYKSHIIISESTKELTGAVKVKDLGSVQVREKEKPIRIFEVLPG